MSISLEALQNHAMFIESCKFPANRAAINFVAKGWSLLALIQLEGPLNALRVDSLRCLHSKEAVVSDKRTSGRLKSGLDSELTDQTEVLTMSMPCGFHDLLVASKTLPLLDAGLTPSQCRAAISNQSLGDVFLPLSDESSCVQAESSACYSQAEHKSLARQHAVVGCVEPQQGRL